MRYYVPKYFAVQELVPPQIYKARGVHAITVFDARILYSLDQIREHYGAKIRVNDWHQGGQFTQRGFRTAQQVGAELSQHRFGRAVDFDIAGVTAEEFRSDVRTGKLSCRLTYVTRIEDDTSWIHIDCASVPGTDIVFFAKG
jgi:uncharacterized protein YcbK (DUF882 family)